MTGDIEYRVYTNGNLVEKTLDAGRADRIAREQKRRDPDASVVIVLLDEEEQDLHGAGLYPKRPLMVDPAEQALRVVA